VEGDLLRQDEPVRLAVDLEDLEAQAAPDEGLELLGDLLGGVAGLIVLRTADRKSTRLNSSHEWISYAVFCLTKKDNNFVFSNRNSSTILPIRNSFSYRLTTYSMRSSIPSTAY